MPEQLSPMPICTTTPWRSRKSVAARRASERGAAALLGLLFGGLVLGAVTDPFAVLSSVTRSSIPRSR
jgi:hypothetical protein